MSIQMLNTTNEYENKHYIASRFLYLQIFLIFVDVVQL